MRARVATNASMSLAGNDSGSRRGCRTSPPREHAGTTAACNRLLEPRCPPSSSYASGSANLTSITRPCVISRNGERSERPAAAHPRVRAHCRARWRPRRRGSRRVRKPPVTVPALAEESRVDSYAERHLIRSRARTRLGDAHSITDADHADRVRREHGEVAAAVIAGDSDSACAAKGDHRHRPRHRRSVAAHPRTRLLTPLPGVGMINRAQRLAEVGPILDRVDNAEQAATECGAAAVTKAVGQDHRCPLSMSLQSDHLVRPQRQNAVPLGRDASRRCPSTR